MMMAAMNPLCVTAEDPPVSPSPEPSVSPELKALNEQLALLTAQKGIAEAEKAIAEARKAKLAATFPSEVKALEGKTTVDDKAVQEPTVVAYLALSAVARQIAAEVKASVCGRSAGELAACKVRIVIHDADQVAAAREYQAFLAQTRFLTDEYDKIDVKTAEPPPPAGGFPLAAVTAGTRGVLDLLSLFRSDVEIKGVEVVTEETALVAALAREMAPLKVLYPKAYALDAATFKDPATSVTLARLQDLLRRKDAAAAVVGRYDSLKPKIEDLKAQKAAAEEAVKAAKTPEAKKAAEVRLAQVASLLADRNEFLKKYTPEMKARIERLRTLNAAVDAYVATLTKVDDKGKSALGALVHGEWLVRTVFGKDVGGPDAPPTYVLLADVHRAGGNVKITKNLWTVFTGSRVRFSGGAIASYVLFDHDGTVRRAGTHHQQTGYGKFKSPDGDFAGDSFKTP
jgi:hypothetical protein